MSTADVWTVARVIREMPAVKIRVRGKVETGRIAGTKLPFPMVSVQRGPGAWESFEFAWETIAHCLTAERILET